MGTTVVLILIVVAVLVVAYLYVWNRRGKPGARRKVGGSDGGHPGSPAPEQDLDLNTLKAGDVVALWDGKELVVDRVVECQETLPARVTRWRWVFLDGDQLLAVAPVGNVLYNATTILHQGSEPYEQITGEVENGGVLKTFEARVREGSVGGSPVFYEHEGQRYRIQSTGTFAAPDQPLPDREVWRDVQVEEGQNVYFRMAGAAGTQLLGIWTSHIALLMGQPLGATDVREIYRVGR